MYKTIFFLLLLLAIEAAQSQGSLLSAQPEFKGEVPTQFIVIIRNAQTRQLVPDARVDLESVSENSSREVTGSASSWWGEAIGGITLGKGTYRMKIVADGYITQVIEDFRVTAGESGSGVWRCGQAQPQGFIGRTIVLGIYLEPKSLTSPLVMTRPLLSDTTYYTQPDVRPGPKGGMQALKKKIDLSSFHMNFKTYQNRRRAPLFARTYIDATGRVVKVDMDRDVKKEVEELISKAIYSTRFTPAAMLGKAVCSQANIPFEIDAEFVGQSTQTQQAGLDVACKNLIIVPSKPRVGDRPWVRFEVENKGDEDIPGSMVEVGFFIDGERVIWSGRYPQPLRARATTSHSVAEQYMEPFTKAGPHTYGLKVRLKEGIVDVDTTNNVIEGILHVAQ